MSKGSNKSRRVVVTGLGVVSSLGIGWPEFWKNLLAGKSGISEVTAFDTSNHDRHLAGEVKNFDPVEFFGKKKTRQYGRASLMLLAAVDMAIKDAKITFNKKSRSRTTLCFGSTTGEIGLIENINKEVFQQKKKLTAQYSHLLVSAANMLGASVATEFDLRGANYVFSNACAAGNYSVGMGFDLIRSGQQDYAVVGGADGFSRIIYSGFQKLHAVAPERCQPFDKNRDGMIPGEGAGVLLLETLDRARKRNAKIYAEITGYGLSCDANSMTIPSWQGVAKAIKKALADSGCRKDDVDYICAHGTGTKENDKAECQAIKSIFGDLISGIPISSIKSMLGHTMGAASALESIACCLAIKDGKIPPTMNFIEKDHECDIDCVPNVYRRKKIRTALNNAQAFGGNNACLVARKCDY